MLVQINDKAALKEFSEFDYKAEIRKKEWRYDENYQQVLGVRIIKPDGTVNEVSTDEYMTATEGRKDREQRQKLAVPGLEIGDKIDIFSSTTLHWKIIISTRSSSGFAKAIRCFLTRCIAR